MLASTKKNAPKSKLHICVKVIARWIFCYLLIFERFLHFGIKFWLYLTLLIPNFPVVCTSRRLLLSPFPLLLVPEGAARRIGGERGLDADAMPFVVFFFHLKQISFFIFVVFLKTENGRNLFLSVLFMVFKDS